MDTHPGTTAKAGLATPERLSPGQAHGQEIADRLDAKDAGEPYVGWEARRAIIARERADVAWETALALGYGAVNAARFREAARQAAMVGLAPSGVLRGAGRISIGTMKTFGGVATVMSVVLDSGAHYDPTRVSSPGNNSVGSD